MTARVKLNTNVELTRYTEVGPRNTMQEELLKLEDEFARAITNNDADALDRLLADDWILVDPDGSIIDKLAFSESSNLARCLMN